jgi:murein DD-endopeptidase MepM/ murein hydrolase activator NlpD
MPDNRYTFFVITGKGRRMRQMHLSKAMVRFSMAVSAMIVIGVLFLSIDYIRIRGQYGELGELRKLAEARKTQIDELSVKVNEFEERMTALKEFDRKIRAITNMEGERRTGQFPGMGGSTPEGDLGDLDRKAGEDTLYDVIQKNMDQLLGEVGYREESFREILEQLQKRKHVLASTPAIWPVMGWVTSEFGYRTSPFTGRRELHRGLDISTKLGDEVISPADGIVTKVNREADMGNMIRIDHGKGICTYYGHLLKVMVREGEKVKRGVVIGLVGNSGRSTGPHLHYSVTMAGVYINPRNYLF